MATANILNIVNAGLVSYDGSATFNGRTLSPGSSKISVSNGSGVSGNPTIDAVESNFTLNNIGGTLSVSKGGTSATSLTAHSLLLGEGTSAITPLGAATNGQIPIGNTGNDPVLSTITAGTGITVTNGAGSIQLDALGGSAGALGISDFVDDFFYPTGKISVIPYYTIRESTHVTQVPESGHPGAFKWVRGSGITSYGIDTTVSYEGPILLGSGQITLQWVVKSSVLSDGTNTYTLTMGLHDSFTTKGCWFSYAYNTNSGKWVIKSNDGSSFSANTNTALDTNWHTYKMVINAAATEIHFYIDGVELTNSPITSNIYTAGPLGMFCYLSDLTGSWPGYFSIDLYTQNIALTSSR